MRAFIVRPFGTKNGIDFDLVEKELVRPALDRLNFSGGTTVEFIQQGNIRTDMFEQLLIADAGCSLRRWASDNCRRSRLLERLNALATFIQEDRHATR